MIPVTRKSQYLYEKVLNDVLTILNENNIELKNIPKKFMLDFETGLQNAVKKFLKGYKLMDVISIIQKIYGIMQKNMAFVQKMN